MESSHPPNKSNLRAKLLPVMLSYGVAGACLYWVFHDLDFGELARSFAGVNWWWVPPAIVFDLLFYVVAGWEWQILLQPAGRLSLIQTTQAILAGRFANDLLPFHVGYVIRVFLVSRWVQANAASVAPSLVVEQLLDGLWLALGVGVAAIFLPLPRGIAVGARIWVGIIVLGLPVAAIILFRRPRQPAAGHEFAHSKWAAKFRIGINRIFEQLRAIALSWLLPVGLGLSLLKLAVQFLAFACLFQAYRFNFPIMVQLAVFLVAYAGLSMPSTPASIGVFQLFCIAALRMFDVPKEQAAGFALLAFAVLTLPLSLAGFIALAQSGLTLRKVRTEASEWKSR
ncbi:MAG TPA: lysylphosphatidylglycerol synthase transmembrane domain-containing protein [Verrucomicrobiae bacterium]|nr:lysylphosphatidylglycerol synthase transmembrane domain-containing protein [Verrucomicrobiae bacterium]